MIQADRIAAGLLSPTFAASAPGDPNRLFIAEKETGRLVLFDLATNTLAPEPFFQVPQDQMLTAGMQGLLGFAFHPAYQTNGRVYLSVTSETGDTEIWEVMRSGENPDVADPASAHVIMQIDRTSADNPAAWIGFGPDGLLYAATGDSASAAQDPQNLGGKLLRVDVNVDAFPDDPARDYGIPGGNPFGNEVFALGLHDPWRVSFDRATGDLYIADRGLFLREEVDFLPAGTAGGANFGWPLREGTRPSGLPGDDLSLVDPVYEYLHGFDPGEGFAVTGGYVYRGPGAMQGHYFLADFFTDRLFTLRVEDGQSVDAVERDDDFQVGSGTFDNIVSFAEDGQGRLYALGLDGELFRFTMTDEPPPAPAAGDGDGGSDEGLAAIGVAAAIGLAFGLFLF